MSSCQSRLERSSTSVLASSQYVNSLDLSISWCLWLEFTALTEKLSSDVEGIARDWLQRTGESLSVVDNQGDQMSLLDQQDHLDDHVSRPDQESSDTHGDTDDLLHIGDISEQQVETRSSATTEDGSSSLYTSCNGFVIWDLHSRFD